VEVSLQTQHGGASKTTPFIVFTQTALERTNGFFL